MLLILIIAIMQPFDFYTDHKCFIRFFPISVRRFHVSFYLKTDISRNYQNPLLLYILGNEAFAIQNFLINILENNRQNRGEGFIVKMIIFIDTLKAG